MDLLERQAARLASASVLDRARKGCGATLVLVGEPGLGKTSLLNECCNNATAFVLAKAACSELEQSVPFGLLDRLLSHLGAPVMDVPPALLGAGASSSADARLQRYSALVDWFRHGAPAPLLLAVDDLHWADIDSIELLDLVSRRFENLPIALVVTARPWPPTAFEHARSLASDGYAVRERLEPLSAPACVALLEDRLGAGLPSELADRITEACGGSPLLLKEVAEASLRGTDLLAGSAGALGERIFLPRFAGVGPAALRWARAAGVLGTRFWPQFVQALSGQSPAEHLMAVDELCGAGLLRELEDGKAEFVHPLFRQALYEDLSPGMRQGLHARAFAALTDVGANPAESAPHAVAAHMLGDVNAIAVLATAGRQALATGAAATACRHFQASIELAGSAATTSLRFELVDAALLAGNIPLAGSVLAELLTNVGLSVEERIAALRAQARVLLAAGRYPEAKQRYEDASAQALAVSPELAAEILLDAAFVGHHYDGPRQALQTVKRATSILNASPKQGETLQAAAAAEANLACILGDPSSLDDLERTVKARLVLDHERAAWGWDIAFAYGLLAKAFERFDDCELVVSTLMAQARRQGAVSTCQGLAINQADMLWRLGHLARAHELLAEAAALGDIAPSLAPFAWIGLAHTSQEQGDHSQSAKWAARAEAVVEQMGGSPYIRLWLCLIDCHDKLGRGDIDRAVEAAERAAQVAGTSGIIEPCVVPWHGAAIEAHVAAGHFEEASGLVISLEHTCSVLPCHAPRAVSAWGSALVSWKTGDHEAAEASFEKALAHNRAVAMPLAHAETLLMQGRFLRRTGRLVRARQVLHQASDVLEGTGAGRLLGLCSDELALAGGRRPRAGSNGKLTAMELRAATLAGQGLTNPQIAKQLFLSAKTVEHHLSRAYAKLGVTSRRELIRAVGNSNELPGPPP
ncbi:MAG TPA: AAA family ATPase [Acidimicrobiales bacterium]|nr:AAA family ATPase [Acidimicrobiales bacterium]